MTRHLPEEARREQILSAARQCFIESGYHPTRMDDIAKMAKLSKGGVYFHFKSKREVFDSLVEEEFERSMEIFRGVTKADSPVAEKLQALGQHYLEYFSTSHDAPRFFMVMGEMGIRDAQLAKRLLEIQTAYIDEIAALLEQGIQEGVLRPVEAPVVAALLKALIDGLELLHALSYPIDLAKFISTGMGLVMSGLVQRTDGASPQ